MAVRKYYESKAWLERRYVIEKKTAAEIAEECNTTEMTISRWLNKHELARPSKRGRK